MSRGFVEQTAPGTGAPGATGTPRQTQPAGAAPRVSHADSDPPTVSPAAARQFPPGETVESTRRPAAPCNFVTRGLPGPEAYGRPRRAGPRPGGGRGAQSQGANRAGLPSRPGPPGGGACGRPPRAAGWGAPAGGCRIKRPQGAQGGP